MKKLSTTEQAFWMGLALAGIIAVVVLAVIGLEHRNDDDDGGTHIKRVPVEQPPQAGPPPSGPAQEPNTGSPVDWSTLTTNLGSGVNGHTLPPVSVPVGE